MGQIDFPEMSITTYQTALTSQNGEDLIYEIFTSAYLLKYTWFQKTHREYQKVVLELI
jgi:hypothetical protein